MPVLTFFSDHRSQRHRDHPVLITEEDQGNQIIIPNPKELEDRKGSQSRDGERQDQIGENREVGSTVDKSRFQDITAAIG